MPSSAQALHEAISKHLTGGHAELLGQLQAAVSPAAPPIAKTEEQALQSALAVLGIRRSRMGKAVEEVADAREWLASTIEAQDTAALELVRAQTACAQAEEAHRAKLDAARGFPAPADFFAEDDSIWADVTLYDEETKKQMEPWKQDLDERVKAP